MEKDKGQGRLDSKIYERVCRRQKPDDRTRQAIPDKPREAGEEGFEGGDGQDAEVGHEDIECTREHMDAEEMETGAPG